MDSLCKAKVSQPRIFIMIQEDIVWLNISVDDVTRVQIVHCFEDLPEDLPLKFNIGAGLLLKEVLQGLSITVLHLDVEDLDALVLRGVIASTARLLIKVSFIIRLIGGALVVTLIRRRQNTGLVIQY